MVRITVPLSGRLASCDLATSRRFDLMLDKELALLDLASQERREHPVTSLGDVPWTGGTDARVYFGLFDLDFSFSSIQRMTRDYRWTSTFRLTTSISP